MRPTPSRIQPPPANYEEEPPAYSSYFSDHEESPMVMGLRRNGTTMRLLPTSSQVEEERNAEAGASSMYDEYGDSFSDTNRYVEFVYLGYLHFLGYGMPMISSGILPYTPVTIPHVGLSHHVKLRLKAFEVSWSY
ncbi:hypothetical protein ARAM_007348 [Aspergillus rambellii]|uniref:Uncharacterized protein n=1 Tax=Aspergillus rambellii TaxID=308745 RepID=A0A0F8WPB0_9EURO|nr:hypothetical protein ARAM_007348 [Aspergillus rambellii]